MPRPHLVLQDEFPYFVNARSNNREWFSIPMDAAWDIFVHEMNETILRYGFVNHAFLLMSNHFHWLVSTPQSNLDSGMRYFMTETSRAIARASGRINKIYGSRYKPTVVGSAVYYRNCYRYLYQNPVRAKICRRVEEYKWSTYTNRQMIAASAAAFHEYIPKDAELFQHWINELPDSFQTELIRAALRRREFKFPRHPITRRKITGLEF